MANMQEMYTRAEILEKNDRNPLIQGKQRRDLTDIVAYAWIPLPGTLITDPKIITCAL